MINTKGKIIIKPVYDGTQSVSLDKFIWVWKNEKCGFIDREGKVRIPLQYESLSFFYSNIARATKNERTGFINRSGEVIIPFTYGIWNIVRHKSNYVEGRILLRDSTFKYGYIDTTNTVLIPYQYEEAQEFLDGHAIVGIMHEGQIQYGAIDKHNNVTIPFIYHTLSYQHDNLYFAYRMWSVPKGDGYFDYYHGMGVIDSNNNVIIPFEYDSIRPRIDYIYLKENSCQPLELEKHLACFKYDRGWSIVDLMGRETTCCYEDMGYIQSGHVVVKKGDWGLIDTAGNTKIPFSYDKIEIKSDGIVTVKKGEKWAYWNTEGKQLSDFVYDTLSEYREGLAIVKKDNKYQMIDMEGKVFLKKIPLDYTWWTYHPVQGPNTLLFKKGDKYGLMDFKGKVLFKAKADEAIIFERW